VGLNRKEQSIARDALSQAPVADEAKRLEVIQ
jgi:hypothetical protein